MLSCLTLFAFGVGTAASVTSEPAFRLHCAPRTEQALDSLGVEDFKGHSEHVTVFASEEELAQIQAKGLACETMEKTQPLAAKLGRRNATSIPGEYSDLAEIRARMQALQDSFPSLAMVVDMTVYDGVTHEGEELPMLKISDNVRQDEDEPNVLSISMHHAREIVTPVIALDMMETLLGQYESDDQIKSIVDSYQIYISPVWNPDGYKYVWDVNTMWRKNRRPNEGGSFGVDQNRNYQYGWTSSCAGSTTPTSEVFKGPSATSEAETQCLVNMGQALNFAKVIDFHSSGREVLFGQRCTAIPSALSDFNIAEGTALAQYASYATRLPSGDGQHQGWHMHTSTTYSYLIETETTFQPTYERALAEAARVAPLWKEFLARPISILGHISINGQAVAGATLSVDGFYGPGVPDASGYARRSGQNGLFHLFLPAGTYSITATAPTGESRTQSGVVVGSRDTTRVDFDL